MFMAVFFIKGKTYSSLGIALRVLVTFRKFFLQLFYPVRDVDHGLDAEVVIQVSEMRPAEESLLRLLMLLQYPPLIPIADNIQYIALPMELGSVENLADDIFRAHETICAYKSDS